jgi:hypothetical protein
MSDREFPAMEYAQQREQVASERSAGLTAKLATTSTVAA